MDEELKQYLEAMMRQINNNDERLLNRIDSLELNFQNTKGFLLAMQSFLEGGGSIWNSV